MYLFISHLHRIQNQPSHNVEAISWYVVYITSISISICFCFVLFSWDMHEYKQDANSVDHTVKMRDAYLTPVSHRQCVCSNLLTCKPKWQSTHSAADVLIRHIPRVPGLSESMHLQSSIIRFYLFEIVKHSEFMMKHWWDKLD